MLVGSLACVYERERESWSELLCVVCVLEWMHMSVCWLKSGRMTEGGDCCCSVIDNGDSR